MKVVRHSYQRDNNGRFIGGLAGGGQRMQIDAIGQVAQALHRVFQSDAEIVVDYTDDKITFRNVSDVPEIDVSEETVQDRSTPRIVDIGGAADIRKKLTPS